MLEKLSYMVILLIIIRIVLTLPLNKSNNSDGRVVEYNLTVWPVMKHYDIWNIKQNDIFNNEKRSISNVREMKKTDIRKALKKTPIIVKNCLKNKKRSKVLRIFPGPVATYCKSNDGRRSGTCINPYECRAKGGTADGKCAMGFGVCCIFIAECNRTIINNMTYIISPNFPSYMPENITNCIWTIQLINKNEISQLRIDFHHFTLGQPNRRNGICDGDRFQIDGGLGRSFILCGQNSGQHIYYDVDVPFNTQLPRQSQTPQFLYGNLRPLESKDIYPNNDNQTVRNLTIRLQFTQRFLPTRLWEINIMQIPFSQRAPLGCLQYFTGNEGIIQTFNFADNGRHLANQNYRICMRQEINMCSIAYQPCDDQSFRIGPSIAMRFSTTPIPTTLTTTQMSCVSNALTGTSSLSMATMAMSSTPNTMQQVVNDDGNVTRLTTIMMTTATPSMQMNMGNTNTTTMVAMPAASTTAPPPPPTSTSDSPIASSSPTAAMPISPTMSSADDPVSSSTPLSTSFSSTVRTTLPSSSSLPTSLASDDVEGSGAGSNVEFQPSRRPRPVGGGFDIVGFLRDTFTFNLRSNYRKRQQRQFYSSCQDRLTMPCIIEDFIDNAMGPLPGCEPIHCGSQFCSSGRMPCRIESTVTPFYIGIHFGDGRGKGSPEDNIGACLRYSQVSCV